MRRIGSNRLVALALISCLAFVFGCLFGNDDETEPVPTPDFKTLTDKENVIYNLVRSYNMADIAHYDELLHADYIWYFNPRDLAMGSDTLWTRAQDLAATTNMFNAAKGQSANPDLNITKLELQIMPASLWAAVDSLDGDACDDCWQTTREYFLTLITQGGITYIASDCVQFTVVPVDAGGTKLYKLWRAEDLPN